MPSTTYQDIDPMRAVISLLGASDRISLDVIIRQGLPLSALDKLETYGFSAEELGIVSSSVIKRRLAQGRNLTINEGDHIYRASLAILLANYVFGNQKKASIWLLKPRKALRGRTALQATETTPGLQAVEVLLERLRHGFAA